MVKRSAIILISLIAAAFVLLVIFLTTAGLMQQWLWMRQVGVPVGGGGLISGIARLLIADPRSHIADPSTQYPNINKIFSFCYTFDNPYTLSNN